MVTQTSNYSTWEIENYSARPHLKDTQMFKVYMYVGVLYSHEEEWSLVLFTKMDGQEDIVIS